MTELKPCPFCGGEARSFVIPWCSGFHGYVRCTNDPNMHRMYVYNDNEEAARAEAIEAWNTRAEPQKVAIANVTFTQEQIDEIKEYCLRNLSGYTQVEAVD